MGQSLVIDVLNLTKLFDLCLFQHVGRKANSLAHALSKWEGFVKDDHVRDGSFSFFVT